MVDYGADPTGAASSVAAFNAALVANDDVFIPPGTYLIDDAVSIGLGKRLRGAGRRKTILHMPSTFNASALGALRFSGSGDAGEISDLSIIQDQPDSLTPTVYPPCIYAQNNARFSLRRLRIPCIYVGIDMKNNSGGAVLDDIEISPLSIGIDIDGALDTVRINNVHIWPFGGVGTGLLTANQQTTYAAAYGIKSGRCDGLHISNALFYRQPKGLYCFNGTTGYTFGQVTNSGFDGDGGLYVDTDARMSVSACYFSNSSGAGNWIKKTGGSLRVSACRFLANAVFSGNGGIDQSAGSIYLAACNFEAASLDFPFVYASGSSDVEVTGGTLYRSGTGTFIAPAFRFSGTSLGTISGLLAVAHTSGVCKLAVIDSDTGVAISGNVAKGWSVSGPTTRANTIVTQNVGIEQDTLTGYFSSDATTTVKLPSGWTVSRLAAGNYNLTHNLGLSAAADIVADLSCDNTSPGGIAVYSLGESTTTAARIRTYVGTTSTDEGVFFTLRRFRS